MKLRKDGLEVNRTKLHRAKPDKASWKEDVDIAEQLCYPQHVISLLKQEPDPQVRQRMLISARNGDYGKWE